jgi:hypothetical protein
VNLGGLYVHFADAEQLRSIRADAAARVCETPGRAGNRAALLEEIAVALEFPAYFGRNWDAFEECLDDLAGEEPVILVVHDAKRLWRDLGEEMAMLSTIWCEVAARRGNLHLVFTL